MSDSEAILRGVVIGFYIAAFFVVFGGMALSPTLAPWGILLLFLGAVLHEARTKLFKK